MTIYTTTILFQITFFSLNFGFLPLIIVKEPPVALVRSQNPLEKELELKEQQLEDIREDLANNESIIQRLKVELTQTASDHAQEKSDLNYKLQMASKESESKNKEIVKVSQQMEEILSINESLQSEMSSLRTQVTTITVSDGPFCSNH